MIERFDIRRALKEAAVDEKVMTVDRDEVLAAGDGSGRADEGQLSHVTTVEKAMALGRPAEAYCSAQRSISASGSVSSIKTAPVAFRKSRAIAPNSLEMPPDRGGRR